MKHILLACCIVALFFSCASVPTVRNSTASEASFEQKLFSSSDYISVRGYGQDAVSAEHNALAGLSRYFSSRISVNTAEKTLVTDHGSKSRLEDMTRILSDTTLFAVQYTKARFNNEQRNYEVIGYINREEAWQVYAPKVRQAAEAFSGLYAMGKQQNSDFRQALFLLQARELALSSDLHSMLQFAYALYPESITIFADVQENLDSLPVLLKKAQTQHTVAVCCIDDDKLQIAATVREILTDLGFSVTADQQAARYVCTLDLTENKTELPAGIFFTPSITITIFENQQIPLFSYSKTWNRIGASSESAAKQRMFHAVITELRKSLPSALKQPTE